MQKSWQYLETSEWAAIELKQEEREETQLVWNDLAEGKLIKL